MFISTQNIGTYDTIHLRINYEEQGYTQQQILDKVEDAKPHGEPLEYYTGRMHYTSDRIRKSKLYVGNEKEVGWYVVVSDKNLAIKGSITKNMFGTNLMSATLGQMQDYIQDFSFHLGLNLLQAKIERVDTSVNFSMDKDPSAYIPFLGEQDHFWTSLQPSSKYWNSNSTSHTKLVYDKIKERSAKREYVPTTLSNLNVLRPENRYNTNATIGRIINIEKPIVHDVFTDDNYLHMVTKLQTEMDNIPLQNNLEVDFTNIRTPLKAQQGLLAFLIDAVGEDKLTEYHRRLKDESEMGGQKYDKKKHYLFRKGIKQILEEHRADNSYTDEWKHRIEHIEVVK
jgi:hypothetical protein